MAPADQIYLCRGGTAVTVQYQVCDDLHAACRDDVFKVHEDSLGRFWSEVRNRRGVRHCANLNH